jgi:choline dehydrogenase
VPVTKAVDAAIRAAERAGFEWVEDHNRPGAVGVGRMPMSSVDGMRVSTADAYLPLGATPANLTIQCNALVDTIVVSGGRATGVRLADRSIVHADHVVLCAGVFASPALLLRSGIGNAADLDSLGIPVVSDLPGVGRNLADHPALTVECGFVVAEREQPALHVMATFRSEHRSDTQTPDLMLWIADSADRAGVETAFDIEAVLLRPQSRGCVTLRSRDPSTPPIIDLPQIDRDDDVRRLREAYRRAFAIAADLASSGVCGRPPVEELDQRDFSRHVAAEGYSIPHTVGTCAMGRDPADGAVVDATLAVHGIANLSVVDASVIPDAPSGFTHLPTLMLAEAFADRFHAASVRTPSR